MASEYYGGKCGVCSRSINGDGHPSICNRCTAEGWIQTPDPDPDRQFSFWKLLWYLMTYKPYQRLTKK